jgi:pimeloyl-ACP methyl ester carboxylesterase
VIDFVADAAAYVERLDEPAVIFGHSLGAMVACGVAARLPERVRALVLEDPTFEMTGRRLDESGFAETFTAYLPHVGSNQPVSAVARELALVQVRAPGGKGRIPLGSLRDLASLRYTAACLRQLDPTVLPLILEGQWLEGYDVPETLKRIACPTLFLQADAETGGALPDSYARELVGQIPDALLVRLPGTGHNIHSTQTEVLLRPLLPFLASLV